MGNEMPIKRFEKFQHIPKNMEGHTQVWGCVRAQGRPEFPRLSPLSDQEDLYKQDVQTKAEL